MFHFLSQQDGTLTTSIAMAIVKFHDRADEFRIEIAGRLQADAVESVAQAWQRALQETPPRRCIVDISRLSGYDPAGLKVLRDMYHHGTQIAASTASSLVFLSEVAAPRRRGPALVREKPAGRETGARGAFRPAAAGE
jgi:ABC-type transporter Mla MlaB component